MEATRFCVYVFYGGLGHGRTLYRLENPTATVRLLTAPPILYWRTGESPSAVAAQIVPLDYAVIYVDLTTRRALCVLPEEFEARARTWHGSDGRMHDWLSEVVAEFSVLAQPQWMERSESRDA